MITAGVPDKVISRYASDHKVDYVKAARHFDQLVKFLELSASSKEPCAPSHGLDKLWHSFLLFTEAYQDFCQRNFGKFVHHEPATTPMQTAYLRTRELAQQRFGGGALDPEL